MAKFCTGCGKELADGLMFCTECGAKVPENVTVPTAEPVPTPPPEPVKSQTMPQPVETHMVSTAHFFWMMLVYSLPFIGWIICIIMAFAPKNESKKHFARAILIWGIVGIVISIIGFIILSLLGGGISSILSEINY